MVTDVTESLSRRNIISNASSTISNVGYKIHSFVCLGQSRHVSIREKKIKDINIFRTNYLYANDCDY